MGEQSKKKIEELEVMEFEVGSNTYGINIAKVKEVVQYSEPLPSPDQNPCVEGILMLRGNPIPVISLSKRLGIKEAENTSRHLFIITSFNNLEVGLHVYAINGIVKLSWSDIKSPDETISRYNNCIITGIVNFKEKILVLLDFEKIVADINPSTTIQTKDVKKADINPNSDNPIMVVDDSQMLNKLIGSCLAKAGYTNIISFANGKEAWDALCAAEDKNNIRNKYNVIISDIEMPVMDGLTLCSKIKHDKDMNKIPVILFSSILDESMEARAKTVGADASISKPRINELVGILEGLMNK